MSVSAHEARRIAELARLHLSDPELERVTRDLNRILEYVDALSELPEGPSHRPATGHAVHGEEGALRDGTEGSPDALRGDLATMAPEFREGFFIVPRLPALSADAADERPGGEP